MPTESMVKVEHTLSIEDLKRLLEDDIKTARNGDNTQNNCGHLTAYVIQLIQYYYGIRGTKPPAPSLSSSSDKSTRTLVATDNNGHIISSAAERSLHGLNSLLPDDPTIDLRNERHAPSGLEDYSEPSETVEKTRVSITALSNTLKNEARRKNKVLFGEVAFAACNTNTSGHVLTFIASDEEVLYIDPQLYNGIEKNGNFLFDDIDMQYSFPNRRKRGQTTFQNDCFYMVYGTVRTVKDASIVVKEEPLGEMPQPTPDENIRYRFPSRVELRPTYSTEEVKAIAARLDPYCFLQILSPACSVEQIQAAIHALDPRVRLILSPECSVEQIQAAVKALKSDSVICSEFSEEQISAAAAALEPGAKLTVDRCWSTEQVKAAASALKPGVEFHFSTSPGPTQKQINGVASLNPGAILVLEPIFKIEQIQTIVSELKPNTVFLLHPNYKEPKAIAAASALPPGAILYIPSGARLSSVKATIDALQPGVKIGVASDCSKKLREAAMTQLNLRNKRVREGASSFQEQDHKRARPNSFFNNQQDTSSSAMGENTNCPYK